jgi:hypothetical protein
MLFEEIVAVYSKKRIEHITTLREQIGPSLLIVYRDGSVRVAV